MKLKDKVAIITGGGAGIGKCLALGFAWEGAKIVITDIDEERVKKAEEELKSVCSEVLALRSDVTVLADINQMVEKTLERFGKIDILVNNAGIYPPCPFLEKDEETFDRVVNINFKGVYFCAQAVARSMVERKYGRIINIASSHGRIGIPMNSEYSGTKGAVISSSRVMAVELAPFGINVNCIACGFTPGTEGVEALNYPKEMMDAVVEMTPLKRAGTPEDYVGLAVLLASDESSFITGQTISVDGGLSMP